MGRGGRVAGGSDTRAHSTDAVARSHTHLISIGRVWHVGTLDPANKKRGSLEGDGLSVSRDPEIWRRIARLGDAPTWQLDHEHGNFLDGWSALGDKKLLVGVNSWATSHGYMKRGRLFGVGAHNDSGEAITLLCETEAEARSERDALGDPLATIRALERWLATPKMAARALQYRPQHAVAEELALSFFCEDSLTDVDGVWWEDEMREAAYSAPRGVIFTGRLDHWGRRLLGK